MGKFDVTQAEWKQVIETEPWTVDEGVKTGDEIPAVYINWDDAIQFGRVLTEKERSAGRISTEWEYTLPTEAQWLRACRASTNSKYHFGDDDSELVKYAWI